MAKIHILIVDDIKQNIFSLKQILQEDNYEIFSARSGAECLEVLLKNTIHIVLLDIQMPEMDGFEVASFIRKNPKTSKIPIIFVTAANQNEHIELEGYQSGAIDIIYKPINSYILIQKIRTLVELITVQQKLEEKVNELTILNEENQKMQRHIEKLASIDYLTNVMNRRSLDENYSRYFKNAKRNNLPISVLMIDLDWFKDYNDHFGHLKGDQALKDIAKVLRSSIERPLDTLGRYGGEEFMIVLPETDQKGAEKVAKKILENVRAEKIEHAPNTRKKILTVSIGIASGHPVKDVAKDDYIECADRHLYEAKECGRDCYK